MVKIDRCVCVQCGNGGKCMIEMCTPNAKDREYIKAEFNDFTQTFSKILLVEICKSLRLYTT